jgi:hypothetical protein
MGFAVISDHSVNAREANRRSRGKWAEKFFSKRQRNENGVPIGGALLRDKMI